MCSPLVQHPSLLVDGLLSDLTLSQLRKRLGLGRVSQKTQGSTSTWLSKGGDLNAFQL